jgi:hypothetical protein
MFHLFVDEEILLFKQTHVVLISQLHDITSPLHVCPRHIPTLLVIHLITRHIPMIVPMTVLLRCNPIASEICNRQ